MQFQCPVTIAEWTGEAPARPHKACYAGSIPASATLNFTKREVNMKHQYGNPELEKAVLSLPEFKGWVVENSTNYSVTLTREKKGVTEEVLVYASYVMKI